MNTPPITKPVNPLRPSDVRGIAQLATQATLGVSRIAEEVHQSVWDTIGVSGGNEQGRTGGITGLVYKTVRGVTMLAGRSIDSLIGFMQPVLSRRGDPGPSSPGREKVLAALNGVLGDHLADTGNPLETRMTMRLRNSRLDLRYPPHQSEVSNKIVLLIHGLCMSDLHWRPDSQDQADGIGEALASSLGLTPIYLRYNTGLHTSLNGKNLSKQLELLMEQWPGGCDGLSVVAHSMGGLLIRSALHYAVEDDMVWPSHLKNIVFLGTPHHGAPLEKAGNWVDTILASNRYTAPFARLGHLRSAGITDLRHGNTLDDDWQDHGRFDRRSDPRKVPPLPEGVNNFTVAASTAEKPSPLADRMIGDGLVSIQSALGRSTDERKNLDFPEKNQHIEFGTNHVQLLTCPRVIGKIVQWLTPTPIEEDGVQRSRSCGTS